MAEIPRGQISLGEGVPRGWVDGGGSQGVKEGQSGNVKEERDGRIEEAELERQLKQIKEKMGEIAVKAVEIDGADVENKAREVAREKFERDLKDQPGLFRALFGGSKEERAKYREQSGGLWKGLIRATKNTINRTVLKSWTLHKEYEQAKEAIEENRDLYYFDREEGEGNLTEKVVERANEGWLMEGERTDTDKDEDASVETKGKSLLMKDLLKGYMKKVSEAETEGALAVVRETFEEELAEMRKKSGVDRLNQEVLGEAAGRIGKNKGLNFDNMEEVFERVIQLRGMKLSEEAVSKYVEDNFSLKETYARAGLVTKEHRDVTTMAVAGAGLGGILLMTAGKSLIKTVVGIAGGGALIGGAAAGQKGVRDFNTALKRQAVGEDDKNLKRNTDKSEKEKGIRGMEGRLYDVAWNADEIRKEFFYKDENGDFQVAMMMSEEKRNSAIAEIAEVKARLKLQNERGVDMFKYSDRNKIEEERLALMRLVGKLERFMTKDGFKNQMVLDENRVKLDGAVKERVGGEEKRAGKNGAKSEELEMERSGLEDGENMESLSEVLDKLQKEKNGFVRRKVIKGALVGAVAATAGKMMWNVIKGQDIGYGMWNFNNGAVSGNGGGMTTEGAKVGTDDGMGMLNGAKKGANKAGGLEAAWNKLKDVFKGKEGERGIWIDDENGGKKLMIFSEGEYKEVFGDGEAVGANFDMDGKFSNEEGANLIEGMKKLGYEFKEATEFKGQMLYDRQEVPLAEFLAQENNGLEGISRVDWSQEGFLGEAQFVGGRFEIPATDFGGGTIEGAKLFVSIDQSAGSQGWYFEIVDGKAVIPMDHPAASLITVGGGGETSFNGGFMEMVREVEGGQQILTTNMGMNTAESIASYVPREGEMIQQYVFTGADGAKVVVGAPFEGSTERIVPGFGWDNSGATVIEAPDVSLGGGEVLDFKATSGGYNAALDHFFASGKDHPLSLGDRLYSGEWPGEAGVMEMANEYLKGAVSSPNDLVDLAQGMGMMDLSGEERNFLVNALRGDREAYDEFVANVMGEFKERMEGGSITVETVSDSYIASTYGMAGAEGQINTHVSDVYKNECHILVFRDKNGEPIIDTARVLGTEGKGQGGILAECRQISTPIEKEVPVEEVVPPVGEETPIDREVPVEEVVPPVEKKTPSIEEKTPIKEEKIPTDETKKIDPIDKESNNPTESNDSSDNSSSNDISDNPSDNSSDNSSSNDISDNPSDNSSDNSSDNPPDNPPEDNTTELKGKGQGVTAGEGAREMGVTDKESDGQPIVEEAEVLANEKSFDEQVAEKVKELEGKLGRELSEAEKNEVRLSGDLAKQSPEINNNEMGANAGGEQDVNGDGQGTTVGGTDTNSAKVNAGDQSMRSGSGGGDDTDLTDEDLAEIYKGLTGGQ